MKQIYTPVMKKFFDMEGRFINVDNNSWLVLKDMFNWLGRLTANGQIETTDRNRLNSFLKNINRECASESFTIDFGKKKGKGNASNGSIQTVDCINIKVVPMVLTQFEPTARVGKERHQKWCELMQFINEILEELEVYKFITEDKGHQKKAMSRLQQMLPQEQNNPKSYQRANKDVANILQVLGNTLVPIYKPMIQNKICEDTIDALISRQEVLDTYLNMYEVFHDFDNAKAMTIQILKQRYNL